MRCNIKHYEASLFEFEWQTADGLQLFARGWQPEAEIQAVVCLVHGIGEHSGRYTHVASALIQAGYVLLSFDLRGHGKSQGQRGHTPSYEVLMEDIAHLLDEAEKRFPNQPRFLYGHSLGGSLVLNYTLRRQPQLVGVIATGPDLCLAFEPPAWKVAMGYIMNNLWPTLSLATGLDTKALSHIPEVVRTYENDPLVHDRISVRMFVSVRQAAQWALRHAAQFPLPLLLMHGSADRLTSAEASRQFADCVPSDCTFKLWKGFYHEIHNEPGQQEVFNSLIAWLQTHTRGQK